MGAGNPGSDESRQGRGSEPLTLQGTMTEAPASLGAGPDPCSQALF